MATAAGVRSYQERIASLSQTAAVDDAPRPLSDADIQALNDLESATAQEMDLVPAGVFEGNMPPDGDDGDGDMPMKSYRPGDTIFDLGEGKGTQLYPGIGSNSEIIRGTATGSPNDQVVIYDRDGKPQTMERRMAILRLRKRYKDDHPQWPGQRVFFSRAPVKPAVGTFPCEYGPACKKFHTKFLTKELADIHFKSRHQSAFQRREDARRADNEARSVAAAEAQVELTRELVARLRGGAPVEPDVLHEAVEFVLPPGDVASWSEEQCVAVCKAFGQSPAGNRKLTIDAWHEHTAAVVEGIRK